MHSGEFSERFARSLICVLGRESTFGSQRADMPLIGEKQNSQLQQKQIADLENETFYESMITDIFIFEVKRQHILGNARNTARQLLEKQLSINDDDKIQSALDGCETIPHSYGDLSTSPMATVYDRMQNLNVSLTLHKRIRIVGGVQGIYGFPSTLVVLSGCGAFIFFIGPRLDDQELSTIKIGELFPSTPFHASITNVNNRNDSKGQLKIKPKLSLPKMRQFFTYGNETSIIPTQPIESYAVSSQITFNIVQVALIIAPSPITYLAAAAGIFLKHRPSDLVRTAAAFGQKTRLLAQAYAPTLIVDSAQLGVNQFGVVGDQEVLIYVLLPNPLYKRMKKQSNYNKGYVRDKDEYEYLPMCAVLNARLPMANSFGDIWKDHQNQLINDYNKIVGKSFRLFAYEQALREWIATGRIARFPPVPLSDFISNIYGLRNGRYISSNSIFGHSPKPITTEATYFKTLNFQNIMTTIQQLIVYTRILNQHRLIVREIVRRFIKSLKFLNIPEGKKEDIQRCNHETLLRKEAFALMCTIGRPNDLMLRDIPNEEPKFMQFLFKQIRTGIQQVILTMKHTKGSFIKKIQAEFQHSLNRENSLNYQYWIKYGKEIISKPIGIESNKDIKFKENPLITGDLPKGVGRETELQQSLI
ncbi:MAG: hypothetical protein EZS28_014133 [Streblomastix strix]|uniref:Uncharacterized protein n=1 Tax=Streblomastix strix TaxID=222440 RepID=A0A5J4W5X8_9EUKA|nr:MAG: hypothetical protein EZS28_014133 [Streblomastix strix]